MDVMNIIENDEMMMMSPSLNNELLVVKVLFESFMHDFYSFKLINRYLLG